MCLRGWGHTEEISPRFPAFVPFVQLQATSLPLPRRLSLRALRSTTSRRVDVNPDHIFTRRRVRQFWKQNRRAGHRQPQSVPGRCYILTSSATSILDSITTLVDRSSATRPPCPRPMPHWRRQRAKKHQVRVFASFSITIGI